MLDQRSHRIAAGGLIALLALVLLSGAYLALTFQDPQVESFESSFAETDDNRIIIETIVDVTNPNGWAIPLGLDIASDVTLNEITVVDATESGVRLGAGHNSIRTSAPFNTSQVPSWWASHVNRGETTVMTTQTEVSLGVIPYSTTLPNQTERIETDFLGHMGEDGPVTVMLGEQPLLHVDEQSARWGTADETVTPVTFSASLENVHDRPVDINATEYRIAMNDIVVGSGVTEDGITLEPGETDVYTVNAAIDTQMMEAWWISHIEQDERTELHIEVYALGTRDGEQVRIPIAMFEQRSVFETDLLGTGETVMETLETEAGEAFTDPVIEETTSEWGEVTDDTTEIQTSVQIVNENPPSFNELVQLDVRHRTTFAEVVVIDETFRIDELPIGEGSLSVSAHKDHAVVPEWWAAHLNNDEHSAVETRLTGEADLAVTTLPLDLDDRASTIETDLLADLNTEETHVVQDEETGATLVILETQAAWGHATPEEGPIDLTVALENAFHQPVTLSEIDYRVDVNGIVLADTRIDETYTLSPGERRTIHLQMVLDNSRMDNWWPTHIENDEVSVMNRTVDATIESGGERERIHLEFLSGDAVIETDLLGES